MEDKERLMNRASKPCSFIGMNVVSYVMKVKSYTTTRWVASPCEISGKLHYLHNPTIDRALSLALSYIRAHEKMHFLLLTLHKFLYSLCFALYTLSIFRNFSFKYYLYSNPQFLFYFKVIMFHKWYTVWGEFSTPK